MKSNKITFTQLKSFIKETANKLREEWMPFFTDTTRVFSLQGLTKPLRILLIIPILSSSYIPLHPTGTYQPQSDESAQLEAKANDYLTHLLTSHLQANQVLSLDTSQNYQDQGDAATWTGLYAAAEAFHYQATGEASAKTNLINALSALHALQFDPSQPGILTRYLEGGQPYLPGNPSRSFVSKDTYTGVLFAYATAYSRLPDGPEKDQLRQAVLAIADNFLSHQHMFQGQYTGPSGTQTILVDLNPGLTLDTVDYAFEKQSTQIDLMMSQLKSIRHDGNLSAATVLLNITIPKYQYVINQWDTSEATGGDRTPGAWCEIVNIYAGWRRNEYFCHLRRDLSKAEVTAIYQFWSAAYNLLVPLALDPNRDGIPFTSEQLQIKSFLDQALSGYASGASFDQRLSTFHQAIHSQWTSGVTAVVNALLLMVKAIPGGLSAVLKDQYTFYGTTQIDYQLQKFQVDPQWITLLHHWRDNPTYYSGILSNLTAKLPATVNRPEELQILSTKALLTLYVLKIGSTITGEARFQQEYAAIKSQYLAIAKDWNEPLDYLLTNLFGDEQADVMRGAGAHLKWLALYQLLALETDATTRAAYADLLEDEFSYIKDERNALANFIHRAEAGSGQINVSATQQAAEALWLFPAYGNQEFSFACADGVMQIELGGCRTFLGNTKARNAVPLDKRPRDTFVWQRNARELNTSITNRVYPGVDFLLPYWLARAHGILNANLNVQPIVGLTASVSHAGGPNQPTTLLAHANSGSFIQYTWTFGDGAVGAGSLASHVYTSTGNKLATVTAQNTLGSQTASVSFNVQGSFHLTLKKTGLGDGLVRSTPAGILCGFDGTTTGSACEADYAPGVSVTLTATAHPGNRHRVCHLTGCRTQGPQPDTFQGWSGSCTGTAPCSLTMNADRSVTAIFCDGDQGCGGSDSGQQGGLESWPLWMFEKQRSTQTPLNFISSRDFQPPPLWKWGNKVLPPPTLDQPSGLTNYQIALAEVMPAPLSGQGQQLVEPQEVIGNSNAIEALAADYLQPLSEGVSASVSAYRTLASVYSHEMAVCFRFKGEKLLTTDQVWINVPHLDGTTTPLPVWRAIFQKDDNWSTQFAEVFAVYVSEDELTGRVESRWLTDEYPPAADGYVLAFQVWSDDPARTNALAEGVLSRLMTLGVELSVTPSPKLADVYFVEGGYGRDNLGLTVMNRGGTSRTVTFKAIMWSAPYPQSQTDRNFSWLLRPGANQVVLSVPYKLNGVVYLDGGAGFVDKVYVANGNWAAFDDSGSGGTSSANIISENCLSYTGDVQAAYFAGCAQLTGSVSTATGYIGVFRTLAPHNLVFDARGYRYVTFRARGDGKAYHVKLETRGAEGQVYQYAYLFTANSAWTMYSIPFKAFTPWGGAPPLDVGSLQAVTWATTGGPYSSVSLKIDQLTLAIGYDLFLPSLLKNR